MDLRIRKYILYKVQNKDKNTSYLEKLKRLRNKMRAEIIDESPEYMDGQPKGKGQTGDVTQRKALKLIEVDRRIDHLEKELEAIKSVEKRIDTMGKVVKDIYNETIKKECTDLTAKAQLIPMGRRQLIQGRAKLLEMFAAEMGEYIDIDSLDK